MVNNPESAFCFSKLTLPYVNMENFKKALFKNALYTPALTDNNAGFGTYNRKLKQINSNHSDAFFSNEPLLGKTISFC